MSKLFKKLILLALGVLSVLSIFSGCTEEVKESVNTNPDGFNSFIDFAKMNGYASPIVLGMKLNLADNGNLIDSADNKTVFYTYDNQSEGNNARAVYSAGKEKFFGVEISGTGADKKLNFIFFNNNNFPQFFKQKTSIDFDDSNNIINTPPLGANKFIDFVQGAGYTLPGGTKVTVSGNDIIESDSGIKRFRYHDDYSKDNRTHAIYKKPSLNHFLGIELIATANSRELKFYVQDNNKYFSNWNVVDFYSPVTVLPPKEFLDNVAGYDFQLPIDDEGYRNQGNKIGDLHVGSIVDGQNTELVFKYVEAKSVTTAVYSPKDKPTKYFGVKINASDNSRMDLYFDNKTGNGKGVYWTDPNLVKFEQSADVLLATKTINSDFHYFRDLDSAIGQDKNNMPTTGEMSVVSTGTKDAFKTYILTSNKANSSGSLFTNKAKDYTNIPNITPTGITSNSLQAIGDKVFIVTNDTTTLTVYDDKGVAITGTSAISNVTDFAIGKGDDTSFYIATKNSGGAVTANLHKVTTAGIQTSVPLASNKMQPKSLTMLGSDVYVAGIVGGKATVNKVSGTTSTDITATGLPATDVTDIKLIVVEDTLYAIINGTANKIFKFDNTAPPKWVDVTGSITLPTDIKSVITDGTVIYITSGVQADFRSSAYKFGTDGVIIKVGGDYGVDDLLNVTPGATILPNKKLYIVSATNMWGTFSLSQSYYKVGDKVFPMPE